MRRSLTSNKHFFSYIHRGAAKQIGETAGERGGLMSTKGMLTRWYVCVSGVDGVAEGVLLLRAVLRMVLRA
jgi:hypothetical protein